MEPLFFSPNSKNSNKNKNTSKKKKLTINKLFLENPFYINKYLWVFKTLRYYYIFEEFEQNINTD